MIYEGTYNNTHIVLKFPIPRDPVTEQDIVGVYAEHIINAELFCYLREIHYMKNRANIPKPIFFAKYNYRAAFHRVMGLEKMTNSLAHWLTTLHTFGNRANKLFLDMLKSIALLLHTLQEKFQFYHRDLHAANVMFFVHE